MKACNRNHPNLQYPPPGIGDSAAAGDGKSLGKSGGHLSEGGPR